MRRAKLIKRKEIIEQEQRVEKRKLASNKAARQTPAVIRTWVKQHQTERTSAYQAFAALFAEPQTKGIA
ncbi:MAG: hypothetical protein JST85_09650 [Acidobacteria bacterium]|nr:hypothetical protein [Acidobacteriota bacterium]